MALETILNSDGFELDWENSADYLHLVCRYPKLAQPLGLSLDRRERQDFLEIVRSAQRAQTRLLDHRVRLGALPARPARLRLALDAGPRLILEAVLAGQQLFEVSLEARSTLRALIHLLIQESNETAGWFDGPLKEREEGRLQLGYQWGEWKEPFSHVVGPSGEWLPLAELSPGQVMRGWLNKQGVWERLSLDRGAPDGPDRLVERGLFEQAEAAYSVMEGNPAKQELGLAYLAVMRGPLLEALPHLQAAREGSAGLSEEDENLLLELETYLLCQQGPEKLSQLAENGPPPGSRSLASELHSGESFVGPFSAQSDERLARCARLAQNGQKLVARQITRDRWAARRALSNWRAQLDLLFEGSPPPTALQVWQGWLAQLPGPIEVPTLSFARPGSWSQPKTEPVNVPIRELPPERSQLAPLLAIALALLLGFWWRWKHPVQWESPPTSTPSRPAR